MTTTSQEELYETIEIDLPAALKRLNVVTNVLEALLSRFDDIQVSADVIYNVQLAVHEVCTNIVLHAYEEQHGKRIHATIMLGVRERQLRVVLMDSGRAFVQQNVAAPDLNEPHVHGYGLHLIHELMDDVQYESLPGSNRWSLVKNL